jgi:hypothetical protein
MVARRDAMVVLDDDEAESDVRYTQGNEIQ